jgi:hypothetical protein
MVSSHPLQLAFEDVAGHITNFEEVRNLIQELIREDLTILECIDQLEHKMLNSEVTLVTDIRILINKIRHMSREKSP